MVPRSGSRGLRGALRHAPARRFYSIDAARVQVQGLTHLREAAARAEHAHKLLAAEGLQYATGPRPRLRHPLAADGRIVAVVGVPWIDWHRVIQLAKLGERIEHGIHLLAGWTE
jgi:hypothetical protein